MKNMKRFKLFILIMVLIPLAMEAQTVTPQNFSLYADIKAHTVGEVVTVLIVEKARASRESQINSRSGAELSADGKLSGTFTDFLPLFGASSAVTNRVGNSDDSKQEDQLTGKLTVRIVEKSESGLLKISGERAVEVNGEENIMRLEGFIRARDIQTDNTVYSYNIADASIVYKKGGIANAVAKPGSMTKWLTWGLGAGLLALAIQGTM